MRGEPSYLQVARDLWRAQREGRAGIDRRQTRRLATLVAHARTRSPFYQRHYAQVDAQDWRLTDLPPVTKPELMAAFDDWVTARGVTRAGVEAFIADKMNVGVPYRNGLFVCMTSGTTGRPGVFVHDRRLIAVYRAMTVVRLDLGWLSSKDWVGIFRRRVRWAVIVGTGSHFAGTGWVEFERRRNPVYQRAFRTFSLQEPLANLVDALNDFDPAMITTYPSALTMLAEEQASGRLRVRPTVIETAGESMAVDARVQASEAFGCPIHDVYGSTEFAMMAMDCPAGWLHVNADWVVLEPVDTAMQPVLPGRPSHTVLLTNLADRVQPIIRYDLGDTVLMAPDPCACGSPFPAIRVEGRRDDVLRFPTRDGRAIAIPPLAIGAALETTPGVHRGQIVQTGPAAIRVRLEPEPGSDSEAVWSGTLASVRTYLEAQGLIDVDLIRADERPAQDPRSGKFRQVIAAPSA